MAVASDSVSLFSEGTFEEQIQELVNYVSRNKSEEERASIIRPFQVSLTVEGDPGATETQERRQKALQMVLEIVDGFGEGTDREIEGFFNLLSALILSTFKDDRLREKVEHLVGSLSSWSTIERSTVVYRILTNIFNTLPRSSPSRVTVYTALIRLTTSNGNLNLLGLSVINVERWISEWDIDVEQKSSYLQQLSDAETQAGELEAAYAYELLNARTLPKTSPRSQNITVKAVASALRLPSVVDLQPLFHVDSVVSLKGHEIFNLLEIFLNDGLVQLEPWLEKHPSILETYDLKKDALLHKMRLLTLSSTASTALGRDLPYRDVASALHIEEPSVEKWVIEAIRAGLVSGKMSQLARTVRFTRSTTRTFGREQWVILEKRLQAWKTGLNGVLEVIETSKRNAAVTPLASTSNHTAAIPADQAVPA